MSNMKSVSEPFPIYSINDRYMLYDVNVVSHIRSKHHMCGCLTGTLPQIPQQNVFLGLPLELMTEEAALLVEIGAAYIVDDVQAHKHGLKGMLEHEKNQYLKNREEACLAEALAHQKAAEERKAKYLKDSRPQAAHPTKRKEEEREGEEESLFGPTPTSSSSLSSVLETPTDTPPGSLTEDELVKGRYSSLKPPTETPAELEPTRAATTLLPQSILFYPTSTVSSSVYHRPTPSYKAPRPNPSSYPLYKHLHAAGYFLSPGLRFGCQFMAYPGDPLRFHSHFIIQGLGWDEEIELINIVGGGRLGTGVKKAWMFGGQPEGGETETRVFSVEWGGF